MNDVLPYADRHVQSSALLARLRRGYRALRPDPTRLTIEIFLVIAALLFIMPVALIFITAFKPDAEIVKFEGIFPKNATTENFDHILGTPEEVPIFRWLFNSVFNGRRARRPVLLAGAARHRSFRRDGIAAHDHLRAAAGRRR
jgi:hypothetical protein